MMLILNMGVSAVGVIILLTSTADAVVWTGTIIFGLGMASTYPTVLTLVEKYVNLSGKVRLRTRRAPECFLSRPHVEMCVRLERADYVGSRRGWRVRRDGRPARARGALPHQRH